jgi:hypothetical protein
MSENGRGLPFNDLALAFLEVGALLMKDPLQAPLHPLGGLRLFQGQHDLLFLLMELRVDALAVLVHGDKAV